MRVVAESQVMDRGVRGFAGGNVVVGEGRAEGCRPGAPAVEAL